MKILLQLLLIFFTLNTSLALAQQEKIESIITEEEILTNEIPTLQESPNIFNVLNNENLKNTSTARIIALNKITTNSEVLEIKVGEKAFFGNSEISVFKCVKYRDQFDLNDYILLEFNENYFDEEKKLIFRGWLVANNLSISSIQHPVYQLIAVSCN